MKWFKTPAEKRHDQSLALLTQILSKETLMSAQLDALRAEVNRAISIEESAIALIDGLAAQILALKEDPAALAQLAADLQAESDKLAADVSANTPSA